ncbi:MAG: DNA-processing protein DprA [Polynucleobacter sp.]|nr:DNA-processing protein DprA [Polynucleobacter sp.]MDZ4057722.1 DNA-processing protein DprA [Polynucleobacter sp.]
MKTPLPIQALYPNSPIYPKRLLDLRDPPSPLYICGNPALFQLPAIAIVGSREASLQGMYIASQFAKGLNDAGYLVISGLARGIDGAAHRSALTPPLARTAAVCGTGLDLVYPYAHRALAQAISEQGLLISEFSVGVGPKPFHFPRRNRLIAALALGVVVVEATTRSGSLITAHLAAEMGREVFAVPGSILGNRSEGCHQLIQNGAKLAHTLADILSEFPDVNPPNMR